MMQNLKRNWTVNSKSTWEIWWILTQALNNLKNLHFSELLLTKSKYIIFELKKYREFTFDFNEYWSKIWRKAGLCFQRWHEELGRFSQTENSDFNLESKLAKLNQNKI